MKINMKMMNIALAIYIFNIFFSRFFLNNLYALLCVSVILMALVLLAKPCIVFPKDLILWIIFLVFCYLSILTSMDQETSLIFSVILTLALFVMVIVINTSDLGASFKIIKIMSGIHTFLILLEYINPTLFFRVFSPLIDLSESMAWARYGSYMGIALTTGMAAYIISIFIGCLLCEVLAKHKNLLFNGILMVLSLFVLTLTNKRTALILVILEVIIFIILFSAKNERKKYFKRILYIILLIMILYLLGDKFNAFDNIIRKFESVIRQGDVTNGRTQLWLEAISLFKQNILYGVGIDSISTTSSATHNVYLQLFAEIGVLGGSIFILTVLRFASITYVNCKKYGGNELLFSLFMQMFFIFYCFFGNPLYDKAMLFIYILLAGYGISRNRKTIKEEVV